MLATERQVTPFDWKVGHVGALCFAPDASRAPPVGPNRSPRSAQTFYAVRLPPELFFLRRGGQIPASGRFPF
ncbi:hypothetical protein FTUN_3931 [Frigoriglobus tundricola]|uniref:Uncharacterized protein n=1 Tax=Frigoriglobus tundricola TaxID=2774151 RepID=A0A6M5YSH5_9BACT|nr:hypothetical protein FTUN_3931 [Frigoriglobus tundricola]